MSRAVGRRRSAFRHLSSGLRPPLSAFVLLLLLACGGTTRPHQPLSAHAEPLRAAFNHDVGRVRILTLVAPT
jgi:hypothetical protein